MLAPMHADAERWNRRYREQRGDRAGPRRFDVEPALEACARHLGRSGRALEIACGAGANLLWLAERGFDAVGVDVSVEGLRIARAEASRRGVAVRLVTGDAARLPLAPGIRFDVVVVVRFLDRALYRTVPALLAPGGLLFWLTFNRGRLARAPGFNPDFLLGDGELAAAFPGLRTVDGADGPETSWLLARRPA